MNVTSLDQCSTIQESDHTEWRNSMVNKDSEPEAEAEPSSTSGGNAAAIVSAVISTILVLILLGLCSAYLYVYGRRNPGGWAEQISQRLEAPYKRFGILDESNNQANEIDNNNQVEMGAKFSENNNTETAISFWKDQKHKTENTKYIRSSYLLYLFFFIHWVIPELWK